MSFKSIVRILLYIPVSLCQCQRLSNFFSRSFFSLLFILFSFLIFITDSSSAVTRYREVQALLFRISEFSQKPFKMRLMAFLCGTLAKPFITKRLANSVAITFNLATTTNKKRRSYVNRRKICPPTRARNCYLCSCLYNSNLWSSLVESCKGFRMTQANLTFSTARWLSESYRFSFGCFPFSGACI